MSSTVKAPFLEYGKGGDYKVEMNFAIRIYTNPPYNEIIPKIGQESASLKGGQRTNYHGLVPLLDGEKKQIGWAELIRVVCARPEYIPLKEIQKCGFKTIEKAVEYIKKLHSEEFKRDGVLTVFYYRVVKLISLKE